MVKNDQSAQKSHWRRSWGLEEGGIMDSWAPRWIMGIPRMGKRKKQGKRRGREAGGVAKIDTLRTQGAETPPEDSACPY